MKTLVKRKELVAEGTLQVTLDTLGAAVTFEPGQYMMVTITEPLHADKKGAKILFYF